jgi:hypothetical protein
MVGGGGVGVGVNCGGRKTGEIKRSSSDQTSSESMAYVLGNLSVTY